MQSGEDRTARQALARIPGFTPERVETARISRLQGLTNRVYAVETPEAHYCLRIPGAGTAAIIDRRAEEANARRAAEAGVAPAILFFGADGLMLTPLIGGAVPLSAGRLLQRPGAFQRTAGALRRLHGYAAGFAGEFRAFDTVDRYRHLLAKRGTDDHDLAAAIREAEPLRTALALAPAMLKPCHCDPTGANLLDTGERIWLVDWEYSGMNDPFWDVAYLSLQADLDEASDKRLITAYLGRSPRLQEQARMAAQKAACELLSAAWALVQASGGNTVADFNTYAAATLQSFGQRIRAAQFSAHLAALRGG